MSTFYKVETDKIIESENKMQLCFPSELRNLYLTKGYGFLDSSKDNFNRIMDPETVAKFRLHEGEYEYMESADIYDSMTDNKLVFFEVSEGFYLSIELTTKFKQRIFAFDQVVAESLEEFIEKFSENEDIVLIGFEAGDN